MRFLAIAFLLTSILASAGLSQHASADEQPKEKVDSAFVATVYLGYSEYAFVLKRYYVSKRELEGANQAVTSCDRSLKSSQKTDKEFGGKESYSTRCDKDRMSRAAGELKRVQAAITDGANEIRRIRPKFTSLVEDAKKFPLAQLADVLSGKEGLDPALRKRIEAYPSLSFDMIQMVNSDIAFFLKDAVEKPPTGGTGPGIVGK